MDLTVQTALIVGATSLTTAVLLSWLDGRKKTNELEAVAKLRSEEKAEDYARQDEVAARAERGAERLIERQDIAAAQADKAAKLLLSSNESVAAVAKSQDAKLEQIHILVNSSMTLEMQKGLTAHKTALALLLRLAPEEKAQIDATQLLIHDLEIQLAERLKQTKKADD